MTSSTPTAAQQRLADLRAEAAELESPEGTTTPRTEPSVKLPTPGEQAHVLVPMSIDVSTEAFPHSLVLERGRVFVITSAALDRARNRLGQPTGIALAADEAAQMRVWGEIRLRMGLPGDEFQPWTRPGSAEWGASRARAIDDAYALRGEERAAALAKVQRIYGGPPTHENVTRYRGDGPDGTIPEAR
ncbi:hypothetical protein NS183_02910 [Microbacterium testaceum]|uniref:hypothetical protein n=1 Tax=Microbacterium testaceum TaxID=2033 RepID=UPI0007344650|nr:hypothetical protein [Microbacterium testaceum]KTS91725.1 hypothetical protein NS183_02910 [Microbacterium testaceum]